MTDIALSRHAYSTPIPLTLRRPEALTRRTVLTRGKSRTINVSQAEEDRSGNGEFPPHSVEIPLRCSGDHVVTDELNPLARSATADRITQSCVDAGVVLAGREMLSRWRRAVT